MNYLTEVKPGKTLFIQLILKNCKCENCLYSYGSNEKRKDMENKVRETALQPQE